MQESILDQIKKYKTRQMSAGEQQAFEEQLMSDPGFAKEVATWAAIYEGIEAEGDRILEAKLSVLGEKLLKEQDGATPFGTHVNPRQLKSSRTIPPWIYGLAAAMLLLLVAWPIYQRFTDPGIVYASADELYDAHFHPLPVSMARNDTSNHWQIAYQQKRYHQAITALEQVLADPNYERPSEANLFLGLSYLGAGQATLATAAFQKVSADSYEWEDAQWFMALACLKTGDIIKAKALFQSIAGEKGNARSQEAGLVLKRLKE